MKDEKKLTGKEKRFIEEYLIDRNGTQAAIRAGYSKKTAAVIASENLRKPYIIAEIKRREAELQEKTGITQEWVLKNWQHIAEYNTAKIQVPRGAGDNSVIIEEMRDANVAQRATDSAAKHLGMMSDKVEVTGKDGESLTASSAKDKLELAKQIALLFKNI